MIKKINKRSCNGCGICVNSCSRDVIRIDDKNKKAVIRYLEDCCSCHLCKIDCPRKCIEISWKDPVSPTTMWGA